MLIEADGAAKTGRRPIMPGFRPPPAGWRCSCTGRRAAARLKPDRVFVAVMLYRDKATMVVIRLARGGANKRPFYNIVVADSRLRRDGRFIERLGYYNPMAAGGEQPLRVALDRVAYWSGVGAQVSPTVKRLLGQAKEQAAPAAA